jgi:hypothetical protein
VLVTWIATGIGPRARGATSAGDHMGGAALVARARELRQFMI